jgi:ubiquinone/menaquinone biosynthesis C-methylase UbiE
MVALKQGESVLETARGSGLVTLRIAEVVGKRSNVFATDLSGAMFADLKVRLAERAVANVRTARMAAEQLDVPDAAFDAAVCTLGLMYTLEPSVAVSGMARAVKHGGRVAVTVWGERRNCGWVEVFPIVDRRVASEVCPLFFGTGAPGMLAGLFARAGLTAVREVRLSIGIEH